MSYKQSTVGSIYGTGDFVHFPFTTENKFTTIIFTLIFTHPSQNTIYMYITSTAF